jgi:hypothetical protein
MGLISNPTYRTCGTEEKNLIPHTVCVWSFGLTLCSFILDPEGIKNLIVGAVWYFSEGTGLP